MSKFKLAAYDIVMTEHNDIEIKGDYNVGIFSRL